MFRTPRTNRRLIPALAVVLAVAAGLAACGVGDVQEQAFFFAPVNADGGTIEVGQMRLDLPAGALEGPTAVSVTPETQDEPIVVPPDDPSTYEVLTSRYCCGPRGLDLLRDAAVRVGYDPALVPEGYDEAETLVLLLWDESLRALVPVFDAVQDLDHHTFEYDGLTQLGHLAVGLITFPQSPQMVFLSGSGQTITGVQGIPGVQGASTVDGGSTAASQQYPDGLYIGNIDGDAPTLLPGSTGFPTAFIPSPDGHRVLIEVLTYDGSSDFPATELWSTAVGETDATLLVGPDDFVISADPTHGWLRQGGEVYFQEFEPGDPNLEEPDETFVSKVAGDGSTGAERLASIGEFSFVSDVRQSPDGTMLLVRYWGQNEFEEIAVIDTSSGDVLSDGLIPAGGGQATPRFLPDSSGVYLVDDDRAAVRRYDADGANESALFTLPTTQGFLKDFVLAPNGDDYAYIALASQSLSNPSALVPLGHDGLYVGSISDGARSDADLGGDYFYDELVFHPDGEVVYLGGYSTGLRLYAADDAASLGSLPVAGISQMDVSREDGRLLLVVRNQQILGDGVYIADADGTNRQPVSLPTAIEVTEARWLFSWRTAPCMNFVNRVR